MALTRMVMGSLAAIALAASLSIVGQAEEVHRLVTYAGPADGGEADEISKEISQLREELAVLQAQFCPGGVCPPQAQRREPAAFGAGDGHRIPLGPDTGYVPYAGCGIPPWVGCGIPPCGGCSMPMCGGCGVPTYGGCGGSTCGFSACCDACASSPTACGCCGGNPCCRSQGLVGGFDVGYLKVHNGSGTGPTGLFAAAGAAGFGGVSSIAEIDPDYELTPRLWVGYQRGDGLGVRARYWEFDHSYQVAIPAVGRSDVFHGWDTWVADIEVTDSTILGCHWDVTWSAGFRYVDYFENLGLNGVTNTNEFLMSKGITGIGLTTSCEVHRQVTAKIGLFGGARGSAIYGDEDNHLFIDPFVLGDVVVFENERNDVKFIWEAQLGAEYILPICGGGYYFARAGVEVQYWGGFGVDQDIFAIERGEFLIPTLPGDAAIGFAGLFATVGIQR